MEGSGSGRVAGKCDDRDSVTITATDIIVDLKKAAVD